MQTLQTNSTYSGNILLVDDDINEQYSYESLLGEIGLNKELISFASGEKAISYLHSLSKPDFPSLIVLDYFMAAMSGNDVLVYLKNTYRFSNIPVIVYSASMNNNMKCDLLESGAVACFKNTFNMEELKIFLAVLAVIFAETVPL